MHDTIDITVVLPVFNAEATVLSAVDSLDVRPGDSTEVLVVDDGSTDGTAELLDEAAAARPWMRVEHTSHQGLVHALHVGLGAARGSYIARMDADDVSLPGRLLWQKDYLDAHPEIGVVSGQVRFGGDTEASRGYALHVDWLNALHTPEDISLSRFIEAPVAHPSVMFRRRLVETHGGYTKGEYPEDYELWLSWMDAGVRFGKVDAPVLLWNDSPTRLSRTDSRYSSEAFYAIKARYLARWLERHARTWPEVIVWGAGRATRKRAALLEQYGARITAWVDIDTHKTGQTIQGVPVILPTQLPSPDRCFVLPYVGSRDARELITAWLEENGYMLGGSYIPAA
ncbi:MAG: glycosyltransferase [Bacteroidia bacterium]|nr:glycosyltransferase [Bacteroidia bacterium]